MASKSYHLLLEDDNVDIDKNGAIIRYDDTFVKEKRNHRLTLPRQSAPTKTKKRARKTIPSSFSSMSSISSHKNTESLVKVAARPSKRYVNLELCMTLTKAEYKKFRELGNIAVSSLLKIEFPLDSQDSKMLKTCKNMIFSSYPTLATRRDSWVVDELVQSVFANKRRYFRQKQQKEFNVLSKAKQESAKNKHADMIFIEETDSEEEKTESEKETSQDDKRSTSSVADLSEETSTSENEYSDDEEEVNTESGDKDIFEEIEFQIEITKEKELKNTTEEENKNLENTTEEIKNLENTTEEEIDCGYEIVVSLPTTDDENENENDNSAKRRRVQI
ncbi:906_t:CDS:2 [Ambispora gerdemannii]|uniref:906_t:CDS:1 n=1 Tax=Ambispora gerdemannii TaxID=144530 RepID=A0A9N9FS82_9GLOM|nr:906_t:CDS:2 [Ambispora gerdemannii]